MGIDVPTLPGAVRRGASLDSTLVSKWSTEGRPLAHVSNGWPHLSSVTGACLCTSRCCLRESGCVCGMCSGKGHINCRERKARRLAKGRASDKGRPL